MDKDELLQNLGWNEEQLSRESLAERGIFELRYLARTVGVNSPTSQSKNDLIEGILAVLSGQVLPEEREKRGRPPIKNFFERQVGSRSAYNGVSNLNGGGTSVKDKNDAPQVRKSADYQNAKTKEMYLKDASAAGYDEPEVKNNRGRVLSAENGEARAKGSGLTGGETDLETREGVLDIHPDGYGFIRVKNCEYDENDAYIHGMKIKKLGLRNGDVIKGQCRMTNDGKPSMVIVMTVNGKTVDEIFRRPYFDDLKPIFPDVRLKLECDDSRNDFAIRSIDLVAPIGKGQRALIVSPPKAGKTTLLKKIAKGISKNYPDVMLLVLLIDERPEEVTDIQRSITGEVVYSTFDETPEHHTMAAEILLNKAKRQVELGRDVVILMDSLTRLARAYNATVPPTGRTLSGGIDPGALQSPKKFFGAARNVENGGSLTIIATALIDTGSRMDDVIYEEFKGTGNMEIILDRRLAEKRIFPAIDLNKSGTRREDLLLSPQELEAMWNIRKLFAAGDTVESTEKLMSIMMSTKNNAELVERLQRIMPK
ncbi:MAG: transcription termination factor Rho [Clostridiales bacterium]|jgi:transcription termination factor Rho|nr:transcription termination factor Rho [Clostridiales bacterium]